VDGSRGSIDIQAGHMERRFIPGWVGTSLWVGGLALYLLNLWGYRYFLADDAFISFRYSRNLAAGYGLAWNPGEGPAAGFSNLLWVLVLSPFARAGLPPLAVARVISGLSAFSTLFLMTSFVARRAEDAGRGRLLQGLVAYVFLGNPALAVHTLSGMETLLHAFLVCWATLSVLGSPGGRNADLRMTLAACWLLILSRPEGIAVAVIVVTMGVFTAPGRRRFALPAAVLVFYGGYLLWWTREFGQPFPNAFYLKVAGDQGIIEGARYVAPFVVLNFPVCIAAAAVLPERRLRWIFGVIVFYLLFGMWIKPWMGFHSRFVYPCFWALVLAGVLGISRWTRFLRRRGAVLLAAALALSPVNLAWLVRAGYTAARGGRGFIEPGEILVHVERRIGMTMGGWELPRRPVLAFGDAGVIPYYSDFQVIDDVGLNDAFIAKQRDPRPVIDYIVQHREPDLAIIPMERTSTQVEDTCGFGHGPLGDDLAEYHRAFLAAGYHSVVVIPAPVYALNLLVRADSDIAEELERAIRATLGPG